MGLGQKLKKLKITKRNVYHFRPRKVYSGRVRAEGFYNVAIKNGLFNNVLGKILFLPFCIQFSLISVILYMFPPICLKCAFSFLTLSHSL